MLHYPFLDIPLSYHSHRSVTINTQQRNNAAPGASTTSRVADSKETLPSWVTWPGRLLSYSHLQMVSGGCVDTELCKSTCLRCGLNRSMCRLGEFFEVLGTLPVQTAETDVAQPLQCRFSHVAGRGVCSLQQSLHCNTH